MSLAAGLASLAVVIGSGGCGSAAGARVETACSGDSGRVALLIGNQDYVAPMQALGNPRRDIQAVSQLLCANRFTVVRAQDLGIDDFDRAIDNFATLSRGAKTALVYYSGHGFAAGRRNWLAPVDARLSCEDLAGDGSVSPRLTRRLVDLDEQVFSRLDPKTDQIVILDACRVDPVQGCRGGGSLGLVKGFSRTGGGAGRLVVYATQDGQVALDGVEGSMTSPLVTAMTARLGADPRRDWVTAMLDVSDEVATLTRQRQRPNLDISLRPKGCLAPNCEPPRVEEARPLVAPVPVLPPAPIVDESFLALIATSSDRSMLERLKSSSTAAVRAAAEQRLAALTPAAPILPVTPPPSGLPAGSRGQIKVGLGGPLTGPNAAFGMQMRMGAEQAVADINARGGVLGQRLVLSFGDDASDPRQGVAVANKFASDGVKWVIGHFNSGVSIPASDVYAESGIIQITPSSTNPRFTERGQWNVFRTCGRDDQQGLVAGTFLATRYRGRKVAIVHDRTPYGKNLADETQKAMEAKGLKAALYEGINTGEKDYSALVSRLRQANVEAVYFGGLHTEAGLIVRQMRDQGLRAPMVAGDGITDSEFAQIAGPGAEGTYMTFAPDARRNPAAREAVEAFRKKNFDPEAYTLYSYAAVQVLAQAAEAVRSTEPRKIADHLRQGRSLQTAIGALAFDRKGDVTRPDYVMYQWKRRPDGKIDYAGNELDM